MSRAQKRLAELRANPKGWRYDELKSILEQYDFTTDSKGGSHRVFKHPSGVRVGLVDAGSGTVLPVYAKEVVKAIDSIPTPHPTQGEGPSQ